MLLDTIKERISAYGYQHHRGTDVISFMVSRDEAANKNKVVVLLDVETKQHLLSKRMLDELSYKAYEDGLAHFSNNAEVMVVLMHGGTKTPFHPNRKNFVSISSQRDCETVLTAIDECFTEISRVVSEITS
jgi:hypothetical protein